VIYTRKARAVPGNTGKWQYAPGDWPFSSQATTDASGRYQLLQLVAGDYDQCVAAPGHLATCEWAALRHATLAEAQALDTGVIQLTKAVTVTIRINDPLSLLKGASTMASPLVAGVRDGSGRLRPGRETAASGGSHTFQVDVPYGTPLNVWLHSWRFLLTDSTGATLDRRGARIPFEVAANGQAPSFVFTIAGEVKPKTCGGWLRSRSLRCT
jgi:hypothetical protein